MRAMRKAEISENVSLYTKHSNMFGSPRNVVTIRLLFAVIFALFLWHFSFVLSPISKTFFFPTLGIPFSITLLSMHNEASHFLVTHTFCQLRKYFTFLHLSVRCFMDIHSTFSISQFHYCIAQICSPGKFLSSLTINI